MKCSVLMSVYKNDNPDFLKVALESIYERQTRKPDEIVIVFDGELTSELYAVLEKFKENKENIVFFYPQQTNQGLGEALRIGTQKCTGEYIFRMDADDISAEQRFEKQLAYMQENPDIDVLGTDIAEFEGAPGGEMRLRVCPAKQEDIVRMGKHRNPMNHVSVCFKRSALEKCGGYETLMLLEDYYLWVKMIACGCRLENMNEALVYVRVGNGFICNRSLTVRISGWKKIQKFMLEHKMINGLEAAINMLYIVGFVYCPVGLKKLLYNKLLRK